MTVSTTASRVVLQGNGATSVWPFAFTLASASDLVVTYTDAQGNSTVLSPGNYTLSAGPWPTGGTVTYLLGGNPIAVGTSLTIQRSVAATQPTSINNQSAFWPAVVEGALDRLTTIVQGNLDGSARALRISATDAAGSLAELPNAAARANKGLGFDSSGNPVAISATPTTFNVAASWPASFGSTPTSIAFINHNSYPTAGMIPAGILQQYSAAMVIPAAYAQTPDPNVNFAAYLENQGTIAGQSAVNYFGTAAATSGGYAAWGNGIITNATAASGWSAPGLGHNFGQLVGLEINPNIWKVGAAAPAGSLDGIRMVGGGDATVPTGGAFGVHFFPLAGYGGMSPTAWSYLLYSEDGAAGAPEASGFASIGAQGTGNSQPSQAIVARARSSGGVDVGGFLQLAAPGNWFAAPSLLIGGLADLAQPIDANALLETYVSANSFKISGVLKNNSGGGSAGVGLGLNVTNSVASEASVSKGGLFMLRTTTKGRGTVGIANRITDDSSPFDPAADTVASWDAAGACKQMINGTLYTLSVVAGVVHAT